MTAPVEPLPYGAWPSPLRAKDVAAASVGLNYAGDREGRLFWIEARPSEGGRSVLVSADPGGQATETCAGTANVRTRVHEYGGRPYAVLPGGVVAYAEFGDQRLRLFENGNASEALTPDGYRYADGATGPDGRTIYWVREDHTAAGEPVNAVVAWQRGAASAGHVLFDASDFVAYPRPSRDGRLAFIAWDHPHMPWDGAALHVGTVGPGGLTGRRVIAGGPDAPDESVLEPVWDTDGALYFLSDRSGYWNLYRWRGDAVEAVFRVDADLGGPLWTLGTSTYALTDDGRALVRLCRNAVDSLVLVDLADGTARELDLPFRSFSGVGVLDARTGYAIAASDDAPPALITIDLERGTWRTVRSAGAPVLPQEFVSRLQPIEFPTQPGPDGAARTAHGFFYPPHNPACAGPAGSKPPLIVMLHGGPTAHASPALSLAVQFWTTRGFAVVHVNYGGSSGFGRAYRDRLRGQLGVVDLQDAVAAVDWLAATGRVDGGRVAIRGGSAGGYTVLAGLAFTRRFAAGINYFGIGDLESLAVCAPETARAAVVHVDHGEAARRPVLHGEVQCR